MNINEALTTLQNLTKSKITQTELGKALGKTRSDISLKAKRGTDLKLSDVRKLENYFNVDLVNTKVKQEIIDNEDCSPLPVRGNLSASLGHGIEIIDEHTTGQYWVSNRLLKELGVNKPFTDFVPCEGDSMHPTIEGGCLLMVDKSRKEVFDGKIYCVRLNGNLMAKRLQFIPPRSIKVISDNKDKYDPFYVDLSKELDFDFEIIGEVCWWGTIAR